MSSDTPRYSMILSTSWFLRRSAMTKPMHWTNALASRVFAPWKFSLCLLFLFKNTHLYQILQVVEREFDGLRIVFLDVWNAAAVIGGHIFLHVFDDELNRERRIAQLQSLLEVHPGVFPVRYLEKKVDDDNRDCSNAITNKYFFS